MIFNVILTVFVFSIRECLGQWDRWPNENFYSELGCTPYVLPSMNYPLAYLCPHSDTSNLTCALHGRIYTADESLDNSVTEEACHTACRCKRPPAWGEKASIECIPMKCDPKPPKQGCQLEHELNKCCPEKEICPPFNVTCTVDGKTFNQGQRFGSLQAPCQKCLCTPGFQGRFESPFCKRISCGYEYYRTVDLRNFCAPVYVGRRTCCAYDLLCPYRDGVVIYDVVMPAMRGRLPKCKLEDMAFEIGSSFRAVKANREYKCECLIPPFLYCEKIR